jgi:tripeptide aminopeptidase
MKRFILTIAIMAIVGNACAQGKQLENIGKVVVVGTSRALEQTKTSIRHSQTQQITGLYSTPTNIQAVPTTQTPSHQSAIPGPEEIIAVLNKPMAGLPSMTQAQEVFSDTSKAYVNHVLDRFLNHVNIESQSMYAEDPDVFPMTAGQIQMAQYIYDELNGICKGSKIEIKMSPDYYIYVKVPSNIKKEVPSVMFMAHMDVTPEANGIGIKPQVHYNYDGGDIALGNGLVLSPSNPEGRHLKNLIGKTIITSDGSTLLGADCKTGCTILVSLIEQMANDKKFKHGDVYFAFSQNEDVGMAAMRMDMSYFDHIPEILIDVDGDEYGTFSVANFTAEGRSYLFKGNLAHPSNGKENGYADARTAMAYFIGQLPPETHPSHSEGKQGYIHCWDIKQLDNQQDVLISFRIRYFDKADGERYAQYLEQALINTRQAYPTVEVTLEDAAIQYDNIANSMHPKAIEVIEKAVAKTGIVMEPVEIRAGTTAAMMVAKGLPGGPCIYSAQQNAHSVYEYCALEEMLELIGFTKCIVTEVSNLK